MWLYLLSIFSLCIPCQAWFYNRDDPDAWTKGGVFPLPTQLNYGSENITISPKRILIQAGDHEECDIVAKSVETYIKKWMFPFPVEPRTDFNEFGVQVQIEEKCPIGVPPDDMVESYNLSVTKDGAVLKAKQVWGFLRGLETLSQLIFYDEPSNSYLVRTADIIDNPRFQVRGLLLDTSRHFVPTKILQRQLDLMAQNKLNVLHWHIVDSESFPYQSTKFPELTKVGAYSKRHIYTKEDIKSVIDYARIRGIRVMPEFDSPGHMGAWRGVKDLLTDCFDENGVSTNLPNLIDPSEEKNFEFLSQFFKEVADDFPDAYIHLGGDEPEFWLAECWDRNPKIQAFKEKMGFSTNTELGDFYVERLQNAVANATNHKTQIFWQDVFDNNKPASSSIIHVWKGETHPEVMANIKRVTESGRRVILSSCWYLNRINYGADWKENFDEKGPENSYSGYYNCDPRGFDGTPEQKDLVLGGVIALWGEMVDATNMESRLWPRASAVAERLWSPAELTKEAKKAWPRMHELRCRQLSRGFRVQPTNWPDFCPFEWSGDN
ncbi:unnamed protein product, partial [Mesorhabditis belari]|uniref:Beta-hexosaminidase n=1 Tax=Mesorhabditis belari TaxID=2138241 RepID=A0AAF3EXD3_9BILA